MKQWLIACLVAAVLPAGGVQAGNCASCHGAAEVAVKLYPNQAGQHAPYPEHALQAYKKGQRRQAEVIKAFVAGLSDGDVADLAAYYRSLQP